MKNLMWLFTCILVVSGLSATSLAGTLIGVISSATVTPIGKILERPELFHMQLAQMGWVAHGIEILQPNDSYQPGDPCFKAYTFTLEDGTGTMSVGVQGHRLNFGVAISSEQPNI